MSKKRSSTALVRVCVALTLTLGLAVMAVPAYADGLAVTGYDSFYAEEASDGSVDILSVTGQKGDTVYINMSRGSEVIASHLAFTLDDETAQTDENGDMVGLVSVSFNGGAFSSEESYSIEVFADRAETKPIYSGEVFSVYAQYGTGDAEPLAVRTLSEDESRAFAVPQTREHKGVVYELESDEATVQDGLQTYEYVESKDTPESTTAHVTYYDVAHPDGDAIKEEEFTLSLGASQDVGIESIIASDADGSLYRTLQLANKVTLAYPGTTEYVIMCKKLSDEWGSVGSFFRATISYTDAEGTNLGVVDSVIVNKPYTYTAPTNIYIDDNGTVRAYTVRSAEEAVLKLEPGMAEGNAEYSIVYEPVKDDDPRTWTVVLENGSVSPKDSKRVIDRITYRGLLGETVTHETSKSLDVDGTTYVPYAAAQDTYEHTFAAADMSVEQVIYYVPDGYVAPEAYDVTVNYVNIATNEVIASETYNASPSMRADLEIESPETFTANGVDWVRLAGQEKAIRHGFYSKARVYTVYYRDVNDDLHATTVIRTVRVEYLDDEGNTITRPTTVVDNGTTDAGTNDLGTTNTTEEVVEEVIDEGETNVGGTGAEVETGVGGGAAGGGATDTGLATGEDLRAIDGDDGASLVNSEGEDLATMRIEDDETPLAGPGESSGTSESNTLAIAIGTGLAAVVGLLLFFVFKRRKRGSNESSDDGATA